MTNTQLKRKKPIEYPRPGQDASARGVYRGHAAVVAMVQERQRGRSVGGSE